MFTVIFNGFFSLTGMSRKEVRFVLLFTVESGKMCKQNIFLIKLFSLLFLNWEEKHLAP